MNKNLMKVLTVSSVSAAMIFGLAGCGRTNDAASAKGAVTSIDSGKAKGDLTIWAMGNEGDVLPKVVKGFEKENPDVKVHVTALPWSSAHDKLQTAIAANVVPDISQMGTTWMADFSNAFATVPTNFDLSGFQEGAVNTGKVKGVQYGVPWYTDTRVLYYRTDIAQKAGWDKAPKNWDELHKMAEDMKKVEGVKYPMYAQPAGTDAFIATLPYSYSAGAELSNAKASKWTIDSEGMKKGLTFFSSLFADKLANPNARSGDNMQTFVSGESPMMLEGPTAVSQVMELGGSDFGSKFATVPLPAAEGDGMGTSFIGGSEWTVFKGAKNPQAAWKFAQYMSRPEIQTQWYQLSSDLPASQEAWNSADLKSNDKLVAFGKQLAQAKGTPNVTTWAQFSSEADRITEQIAQGKISVDDAVKALQTKADSIGLGE